MIEFNDDGSLRLPSKMKEKEDKERWRMKNTSCISIKKEIVSFNAPKRCLLHFELSDKIRSAKFIKVILDQFKERANTPMKLKVDDSVAIEIGTDFKRCTECNALVGRFREHMNGNLILKEGNCTFKGRNNFSYDDFFE